MLRRRLLAMVGLAGVTGLGGCTLSREASPSTPTAVDSVSDWSFERSEPDQRADHEDPPTIECRPADKQVHVAGVMEAGTDCDTVAPTSMTLEGEEFEFVVGVYEGGTCGEELTVTAYEATVTFEDPVPASVTAIESISQEWGETQQTALRCGE